MNCLAIVGSQLRTFWAVCIMNTTWKSVSPDPALGFCGAQSVTSYFFRLLPRWLAWFGILIAAAGELASFSLLTSSAAVLIPIVRFAVSCG